MQKTPRDEQFQMPAEWTPHAATWLAWPSAADLWQASLPEAQKSFAALCRAIARPDASKPAVENLEILVPDERRAEAQRALEGLPVRFHAIAFGDIWLRDTAPLFLCGPRGAMAAVRFVFNGWGGKYVLSGDNRIAEQIAAGSGLRTFAFPWVLEGGAVDVDGEGTVLTTRQCLLNPNRNPGRSEGMIEDDLRQALGVRRVLWIDEGLKNDHTDGHVDTIARFVGPGRVMAMAPTQGDPNEKVMKDILAALRSFTDAEGRKLDVMEIPSPGRVENADGELMPASYANFYIANAAVAVPTYGVPNDDAAVKAIAKAFPDRTVIGIPGKAILTGGGAFHCITQQVPQQETSVSGRNS